MMSAVDDGDPKPSTGDQDAHCKGQVDYYEAYVSIKAKLSIVVDIYDKLKVSQIRLDMFKATCFGPWLDIQSKHGDPLLVHLMLQTQFFPKNCSNNELWFHIGGHDLRFGREEFCLLTGLRFGHLEASSKQLSTSFRDRVFSHIPTGQRHVLLSDVQEVFHSSCFTNMPDLDAVRICLLLLVGVGFMGRPYKLMVPPRLLHLVEDLNSWNSYPWGSYVWQLTHSQLKNALTTRIDKHTAIRSEKVARYSLHGFVYAFKIWIYEVFPNAKMFVMRRSNVIPRAVAWHKDHTITWDMCLNLLDLTTAGHQPLRLTPTAAEMEADWWRASRRFFDGVELEQPTTAKIMRDFQRPSRSIFEPVVLKQPMKKSRVGSPWRQLASPFVRDNTPATIPEDRHQHRTVANSDIQPENLDMLRGLHEIDRRQEHTVVDLSKKVPVNIELYEGRYDDLHSSINMELPSSVDRATEDEVRATTMVRVKTEIPTESPPLAACRDLQEIQREDHRLNHVDADVAEVERSPMVRVMVCSGGSWEVVNKILEYRPLGLMRRTLQLPLSITYVGLMNRVARKLNLSTEKGFRMSYKILSSSSFQCNTEEVIEMVDDEEVSAFIDVARNMLNGMVTLYVFESFGRD